MRVIRPTRLTFVAAAVILAAILGTAVYLLVQYDGLPDLLAVHFNRAERANGWQFKTHLRVLTPIFIQAALAVVSVAVAFLLLTRSELPSHGSDDLHAALVAAEAVVLFAAIWVVFQSYVAQALVTMWRSGRAGLGGPYVPLACAGGALSLVVAARAQSRLGVPAPRPFVAEHWRLTHLYNNPQDPALFVPTRDGGRWTLNFGRPIAAVIMAVTLLLGVLIPAVVLRLLLR